MIIVLLFYAEIIHSDRYVRSTLQAFFKQPVDKQKFCGHFQQHSAKINTAEYSIQTLKKISGKAS
jgi:hypothetical protein